MALVQGTEQSQTIPSAPFAALPRSGSCTPTHQQQTTLTHVKPVSVAIEHIPYPDLRIQLPSACPAHTERHGPCGGS
jgi:hypothetical protein